MNELVPRTSSAPMTVNSGGFLPWSENGRLARKVSGLQVGHAMDLIETRQEHALESLRQNQKAELDRQAVVNAQTIAETALDGGAYLLRKSDTLVEQAKYEETAREIVGLRRSVMAAVDEVAVRAIRNQKP
ncbi:hypothetical protein SPF06_19660 [Sinomonas sp. JGH33]|uniref:Uncharacterized protein n=1 Tax=Sinomonas terricola TaxID=3110330 RepID=A0ABU5TB74_9MICC|nr:hypothetical protein [Sinomonas sp. JGH33]MEA5456945.1 hypothetical protein [Sinomonas sp. JGH33]